MQEGCRHRHFPVLKDCGSYLCYSTSGLETAPPLIPWPTRGVDTGPDAARAPIWGSRAPSIIDPPPRRNKPASVAPCLPQALSNPTASRPSSPANRVQSYPKSSHNHRVGNRL
ncbi:hypothetical protein LZ30DRAFT_63706 [Colletotrichum cereale]|nr:hypothetical protein LZ30DRAFT_63706 [Colletotrichum cereale]